MEEIDPKDLTNKVKLGQQSGEARKYFGRYLQREVELIVRKIITCEPTYNNLLEHRADLKAIYKLDAVSGYDVKRGKEAQKEFVKKVSTKGSKR